MSKTFSDNEIAVLIREPKSLDGDFHKKTKLRQKRGHKERDIDLSGESTKFRLILRQNDINVLDFSIILAVYPPGSNRLFRLLRYNGKSHEHTN